MFKGRRRPFVRGANLYHGDRGLQGLLASVLILGLNAGETLAFDQNFFLKPYLQMGSDNHKDASTMDIVWFSEEAKQKWQVDYKTSRDKSDKSKTAASISESLISLAGFNAPYYKLTAHLDKLVPGETFDYKVLKNGKEVFSAKGKSKKAPGQKFSVAIFGDCGSKSEGQRMVAEQVSAQNPDLVVIPGDITYQQGLFSQYLTNFFPFYNQDPAKPGITDPFPGKEAATAGSAHPGLPLMRSILFAGVIGNHDISLSGFTGTDLNKFPDALAYFLFWNQPLNGPILNKSEDSVKKNYPFLAGESNRQELFKKSADKSYPVMANYSFDYGDVHFTALDGNYYMDWNNPKLRSWLAEDLKNAQGKAWRILVMHQPGFLIGVAHDHEQQMRLISDIAQKYKVDMVIAGHAHCYERSFPLTFKQVPGEKSFKQNADGTVFGAFQLDKTYDGVKNTKPNGIIYIVSGEGGAHLYPIDAAKINAPESYMTKWDCTNHSFSALDIDGKTITFKQIAGDGKVIDQFALTK